MPNSITPTQLSSYLQYLPAVFQQVGDGQGGDFLGRFLLTFEHILSGLEGAEPLGVEEIIDGIDRYFYPEQAPEEFLDWLASWVALTLRADWSENEQRRFIAGIVPLYQQRGTKAGLLNMLHIFTNLDVKIEDFTQPFQVGVVASVGEDTVVTDNRPHSFVATVVLRWTEATDRPRKEAIVQAIIEQEKPAHTSFDLRIVMPRMAIGVPGQSEVGMTTFVG